MRRAGSPTPNNDDVAGSPGLRGSAVQCAPVAARLRANGRSSQSRNPCAHRDLLIDAFVPRPMGRMPATVQVGIHGDGAWRTANARWPDRGCEAAENERPTAAPPIRSRRREISARQAACPSGTSDLRRTLTDPYVPDHAIRPRSFDSDSALASSLGSVQEGGGRSFRALTGSGRTVVTSETIQSAGERQVAAPPAPELSVVRALARVLSAREPCA